MTQPQQPMPPEHDPVPGQTPPTPQEVPAHDPPLPPEHDSKVLFDANKQER
jgi:hypothetical protein